MAPPRSVKPVLLDDAGPADGVADVLVVGFGCAGACAAYEAATAGADVLVLERASGAGGTSALSGGELYLGAGTALQREVGIEDSPEAMAAFLREALGPARSEEHTSELQSP